MRRLPGLAAAVGVAAVCVAAALAAHRPRRFARDPRPRSLPLVVPGAMVRIPGGTFRMGSNDGYFDEERPVHAVTVASFDLDVTEVTVAAYAACARRGACAPAGTVAVWPDMAPAERALASSLCNADRPDRQDHPANCLTWPEADAYCRAVGRRLPTEAEWEYAARGGREQRTYAWGDDPPTARRMNACGAECAAVMNRVRSWAPLYPESDGWVGTAPVGSFPAGDGRWGLVDLSGNVQEWLASPFCPYPAAACASPERCARGPGFLGNQLFKMRAARRNRDVPWHRSADLGLRCARTP